jgi:hypothetical protein
LINKYCGLKRGRFHGASSFAKNKKSPELSGLCRCLSTGVVVIIILVAEALSGKLCTATAIAIAVTFEIVATITATTTIGHNLLRVLSLLLSEKTVSEPVAEKGNESGENGVKQFIHHRQTSFRSLIGSLLEDVQPRDNTLVAETQTVAKESNIVLRRQQERHSYGIIPFAGSGGNNPLFTILLIHGRESKHRNFLRRTRLVTFAITLFKHVLNLGESFEAELSSRDQDE